jgi:GMP synthase (glutamine-hydrolysing)
VTHPLVILVAGDPVPEAALVGGTFSDMIRVALGDAWMREIVSVDVRQEGATLPESFSGLIVTGSASSVTERAPWMLRTEALLRREVEKGTSVFGVCFGHQILAQALGGRVDKNPRGREIGSVKLEVLDPDATLFDDARDISVNATHVDTVVELPPGASVLARTALDQHAVLRFAPRAYSVQFHPELDGSLIGCYIHARRSLLEAEGLDPDGLAASARDAPKSVEMMRRFTRKFMQG